MHHYIDTCLPFGFRHRSALFQHLSNAVRHIMRQEGYDVINYIDVVIGIGTKIHNSFTLLQETLIYLAFELSNKKIVPPITNLNCLGIMVNTTTFTASIPSDKLQEIFQMCSQWRNRQKCNRRDLQSLLGSLLCVSKCVKTSRFFLNHMLEFLRSIPEGNSIQVPVEFHQDLNWFLKNSMVSPSLTSDPIKWKLS